MGVPLYSQVKAQAGIRALINFICDTAGHPDPQPAIFLDMPARVMRGTEKGHELREKDR